MKSIFVTKKRPLWVTIVRKIGYVLLFLLSPVCFVVGDILSRVIFADSDALSYLSLLLFIVSVMLSLPLAYLLLINKMRKRMITICHILFQSLLIGSLLLIDNISLRNEGNESFLYDRGFCSTTLGGVFRTNLGQKIYSMVLDSFPLTTKYSIDMLEDTCRLNLIKSQVETQPEVLCAGNSDRNDCLKNLFHSIERYSPLTSAGIIMQSRYRQLLVAGEVKLKGKLHPIDHLKYTALLIDTSIDTVDMLKHSTYVFKSAGHEIVDSYSNMSQEEKAYYEVVISNQFLNLDNSVPGPNLGAAVDLISGRSLRNLPDDVNRDIAEFVLISMMDGKLRMDFIDQTNQYVYSIIEKSLKTIKTLKNLSKQERKDITQVYKDLKSRMDLVNSGE